MEALFENLTSYKNRNRGIRGRSELHIFSNVKLADNAIGMTHSTDTFGSERFTSRLIDSLVVGETDNIGNPTTPDGSGTADSTDGDAGEHNGQPISNFCAS